MVISCDKGKILHVSPTVSDELHWNQVTLKGQFFDDERLN